VIVHRKAAPSREKTGLLYVTGVGEARVGSHKGDLKESGELFLAPKHLKE